MEWRGLERIGCSGWVGGWGWMCVGTGGGGGAGGAGRKGRGQGERGGGVSTWPLTESSRLTIGFSCWIVELHLKNRTTIGLLKTTSSQGGGGLVYFWLLLTIPRLFSSASSFVSWSSSLHSVKSSVLSGPDNFSAYFRPSWMHSWIAFWPANTSRFWKKLKYWSKVMVNMALSPPPYNVESECSKFPLTHCMGAGGGGGHVLEKELLSSPNKGRQWKQQIFQMCAAYFWPGLKFGIYAVWCMETGHTAALIRTGHINPFTPKSDQLQISPAASAEILHCTAWRTWLFIAYTQMRNDYMTNSHYLTYTLSL